ncbi:hypothetical protein [Peribacillus tepidiphilus]|uniref:hypothetical protein n=1 Tax=Peribacillus tepidiphilus TaxID=2652445 RepID=UPI0030B810BC
MSNKWNEVFGMFIEMLFRFFSLLTGFGLAVSGSVSSISYLNLLSTGHNYIDYLYFLVRRPEFYLLPIGLVMMVASIYFSGPFSTKNKNDYKQL